MMKIYKSTSIGLALISLFIFYYSSSFSFSFLDSTSNPKAENKKEIAVILQEFFRTGNTSKILPFLPEEARIFLSLDKIKNAKGFFSSHQTLLIFKDFFHQSDTVSVQTTYDQESQYPPLTIQTSLIVRDKNSKIKAIDLNITLQKQAEFWKIKEIKEMGS